MEIIGNFPISELPNHSLTVEGTAAGGIDDGTSIQGGAGGSSSDASNRSIIVVGGRNSDTFFGTIDDSWNLLNQNQTRQTADLFGHQFGAVVDMVSTVDQAVQLQKNLASNLFLGGLRV
jgi:hypothetical protein